MIQVLPARVASLAAVLLPVLSACVPAAAVAQEPTVRFFFVADAHSRHAFVQRFLAVAVRERPDLIVDGGDTVHDGTEPEFGRAAADRALAGVPWHPVRGNHDAVLRGPFRSPPPEFPSLAALDHGHVRFILLDNHDGTLDDAQFAGLEAALDAAAGRPVIIVMHVPPFVERERTLARLRGLLPFPLADPAMPDGAQVERFVAAMERHGVLAVLTGHTHAPGDVTRGGVRYITAGALGGLTPGMGIANEFLDITVAGRDVQVVRRTVQPPAGNPVTFAVRAFTFYTSLNGFNHRHIGWSYVPSASVQLRTGLSRLESGGGERPVASVAASFERVVGDGGIRSFHAEVGALGGRRDAALTLAGGFKWRPVGSFNRNGYAALEAEGNGGVLADRWTAGVGARAGVGVEWRTVTLEFGATRATNYRAATFTAGRRF